MAIEDLANAVGGVYRGGTASADTITTGDEADLVFGDAGDDIIRTGDGMDYAEGGSGDDDVALGGGNDIVYGFAGNDTLDGGAGVDNLNGDQGNDVMNGGDEDGAADTAYGGDGNDTFMWATGSGNDRFFGELGKDTLEIGSMNKSTLRDVLSVDGMLYHQRVASFDPATGMTSISFTSCGQPVSFSGSFTYGGETVRFSGVETITVPGR